MTGLGLDSFAYHYAGGLWEYSPTRRMTAEDYLTKATELGLDGVQFCDTGHFPNLSDGYIDHLGAEAGNMGLYVELGTGGLDPEHLRTVLVAASRLNSTVVRTFIGRPRPTNSDGVDALLQSCVQPLTAVAAVCDSLGVSLAIENHCDITTTELVRLVEMVDSPWIGICFDNGNTLALFEDPLESLERAQPFIKSVHLKDYQIAPTVDGYVLVGCALGEGIIDLSGTLSVLASQAPDANLNIETFVGTYPVRWPTVDELSYLPEDMARGVAEIKRLLHERGLPEAPVLPVDRCAPESEVLAHEDALVRRSVTWATRALGRRV